MALFIRCYKSAQGAVSYLTVRYHKKDELDFGFLLQFILMQRGI
jgi:hypothetical protein